MHNLFYDRYSNDILGVNHCFDRVIVNCFDRVIVNGNLIPLSYPKGLGQFLTVTGILIKKFQSYAASLSERLKEHAKQLAEAANAPYIYLNNSQTRKESLIKSLLETRGSHPGLIAVLSSLEVSGSFDTYRNKKTHKLEVISRPRKSLHFYFYFIDEQLGLCYFCLQNFFPFRVHIYYNGREQLARQMDKAALAYQKEDNCFTDIDDFQQAQLLADVLRVNQLHALFDQWVDRYVSILPDLRKQWNLSYHWSIRQIEYAHDLIFQSQATLDTLYKELIRYVTCATMPEDILSFLGKKFKGRIAGKVDTSTKKSYLGYRIKHRNGAISLKMYNKCGNVLRIEVTINDLAQLKVNREVVKKNGQTVKKIAPIRKSIYSLEHVLRVSKAVIKRYLDFLAHIDDNSQAVKELRHLTERKTDNGKNYKGFNPLNREDSTLFALLLDGGFIATGFTNKDLKLKLVENMADKKWNVSRVSRLIKRLRVFGLLRRVHNTYRYFLSEKGRVLITLSAKITNLTMIPATNSLLLEIA
jgi:hypothetical protein